MNTNIILDGFNAMLKQLIAAAVAEAVKPLQDRINMLETQVACSFDDEKKMVGDRLTALEINQSMGKAVFQMADIDFNEAVRNVLDGSGYVTRNEVVDLVTELVDDAIENHDFDLSDEVESAIGNYDFSEIVEENMPDQLDKDVVQDMINESLDNLSISRN